MTQHKPVIETMINTAAIAIATFGTNLIMQNDGFWWRGMVLILFAAALEFVKYYGRKKKYW